MSKIELYEYNQNAYLACVKLLSTEGKAAVIHPTGTGKSFIGFKLCEDNPGKTICWLSPSEYIFKTQLENLKKTGAEIPKNIKFFSYSKLLYLKEIEYYYLPQFHAIPENDRAWGKGFTEWTNVKKAKPLFEGQYQPKIPLNNNYYCLLEDEVKIWQAELAKEYGVFGFCYYHYWFKGGRMLLEKPAEQMLANKMVDIPFCFSWANENWSKRWDGGNHELIAEQDYGMEADWKKHLEYLIPFFKDERYITLNGDPIFLIYKPEEIPNVDEMLRFMKKEVQKYGFSSICFMIQNPNWFFQPSYRMGEFSYQIKFHPFFAMAYKGKNMDKLYALRKTYHYLEKVKLEWVLERLYAFVRKRRHAPQSNVQTILDYDEIWNVIIDSEANHKYIEGAFTDWDNTARKTNGYAHVGSSPEKFEKNMSRLFKKICDNDLEKIVFINAWNEWCEGAYLEPDELHGYAYLEGLKKAIAETMKII